MRAKRRHRSRPGTASQRRLVVGVFADEHNVRPPYGEQNTFVERLFEQAERMGISLYAFSVDQPHIGRGRLVVRRPGGSWPTSTARPPDVVYDRAIFERRSDRRAARALLGRLRQRGVPVFNPVFGNKMVIHRYLGSRGDTRQFLPDTARVNSVDTVFSLLRKWGDVYFKPSIGTQGGGVLRVRRLGHRFAASGFTSGLRHIVYTDLGKNSLARLLRTAMGSRHYLVQQAIDTITWRGCRTDVRALTQRDREGIWRVTGVAARVATGHGDVCNLHRGGRPVTLNTLLREMGRTPGLVLERTHAELVRSSLAISRALALRYPLLGELGLDFVIDKGGTAWFIEANPRPGRSIFRVLGMSEEAKKSIERPLEYAAYLVSARPGGRGVVSHRV